MKALTPDMNTAVVAGQWQPIATHDGSADPVDIFYPERGRLTDAVLRGKTWGREEWRGAHTVWFVPSEKPSHWMPVPSAPAAIAQAQQVTHD